jgi:hypothetical protein
MDEDEENCESCDFVRGFWPRKTTTDGKYQVCDYYKDSDFTLIEYERNNGSGGNSDTGSSSYRILGFVGAGISLILLLMACVWLKSINK